MEQVARLAARAARSRRQGYGEPVIATAQEAKEIAERAADALACLPETERLWLASTLQELSADLGQRMSRLEREMAEDRERLAALSRGLAAQLSYAAASGLRRGKD